MKYRKDNYSFENFKKLLRIFYSYIRNFNDTNFPGFKQILFFLDQKLKGIPYEIFDDVYLIQNPDVKISQTLHILCYGFNEKRSGISLNFDNRLRKSRRHLNNKKKISSNRTDTTEDTNMDRKNFYDKLEKSRYISSSFFE